MYVLVDMEWISNQRGDHWPTQLAAARVDAQWNTVKCKKPYTGLDRRIFTCYNNILYSGIAKLVSRLVWECRVGIRDGTGKNAAKPCDTCVCGISPNCRKRHKIGFDHINDHRQKIFIFPPRRGIMAEK